MTTHLTTTAAPAPAPAALNAAPAPRRDWRPSQRARGLTLAAGGALYSLSHVLNLFGSSGELSAPHEVASKYLFGIGALLIMGGLGSLMRQFSRSALGVLGVQLTWLGMLLILLNAYSMLFILPVYGWEGIAAIGEQAAIVNLVSLPTVVLGPVLLAIASWRHGAMSWWQAALLLASTAAVGVMIAVPAIEVPLAISSTIIAGVAYAATGLRAAARRGAEQR